MGKNKAIYQFGLPVGTKEFSRFIGLGRNGKEVSQLEEKFKSMFGAESAVATYKGRTAIYLILKSLESAPGDEVILPSFVCETVIKPILLAGLRPRLVDIDEKTFTLDPDSVARNAGPKTRAIIAVHTFGQPCDLKALGEIAADNGSCLIEDCAQAIGAEYKGEAVGSIGDASIFSYHLDKMMDAGFGGVALTKDRELGARMEKNRTLLAKCTAKDDVSVRKRFLESVLYSAPGIYGLVKRPGPDADDKPYPPSASHGGPDDFLKGMSPLSAAIGLTQLSKIPGMIDIRRRNALILEKGLKSLDHLELPGTIKDTKPAYLNYSVKVRSEDCKAARLKIIREMNSSGMQILNYIWPFALHQLPYYSTVCNLGDGNFSGTDSAVDSILNLPTHPLLRERDMQRIVSSIANISL